MKQTSGSCFSPCRECGKGLHTQRERREGHYVTLAHCFYLHVCVCVCVCVRVSLQLIYWYSITINSAGSRRPYHATT